MTVEEMHIAIDMDLQKVNTYTQKNLLPQEKDFFLNGEVLKFIKQRINPKSNIKGEGIDKTTKRFEDLSDLRVTKELNVEVDSENNGIVALPDDYYSYSSSLSNIYQICTTDNLSTQSQNRYKCVFPLSFDPDVILTTYTIVLKKTSGDVTIFDLSDLPSGYIQDVDINKQQFMLLKAIKILAKEALDNVSSSTYDFYWETYAENFYNNNFIIISDESFTGVEVTINATTTPYSSKSDPYNYYDETSPLWSKNRLMEQEFQHETYHSYLSNSRPESPVISINQQTLKIAFPENAICQRVRLTYISRPTLIDILLQRNLNMKDTICEEIVSNTVRFLKGVFNGDYQTYLNENTMIE